jgi:8-oxo-dGTP diphosphatase
VSKARTEPEPEVLAAGGVIWRTGADGIEVLLVHRPKYDDWTFAKGKLEPGERFRDAARREVLEETGFQVELGDELEPTSYVDGKGRRKLVRYWTMTVTGGSFARNDEVDQVRWMGPSAAADRLSYERDVPLVASFERWLRSNELG